MLGALPAIGFLDMGLGIGPEMGAMAALSGFAGALAGPPQVASGPLPPYTNLGAPGLALSTGYLGSVVGNLNPAPWPDVNYAQIYQAYAPYAYGSQCFPYQPPAPAPAPMPPVGQCDCRNYFANPYMFGSYGSYQAAWAGAGYGFGGSGGCDPFFSSYNYHPPMYCGRPAYGPPPCGFGQGYAFYGQQTGQFSFGASCSSAYAPPGTTGSPLPWYTTVSGGKVHWNPVATFETNGGRWAEQTEVLKQRLTGSLAEQAAIHLNGQDPRTNFDGRMEERTTVWSALQANDRLRYNCDTHTFFITYVDGSTRNVETLQGLMNVRRAAGFSDYTATKAVWDHLQMVSTTTDLIYPPYVPGATLLPQPFGTQWDAIFPRPDNSGLYGWSTVNLSPNTTLFPPGGLG